MTQILGISIKFSWKYIKCQGLPYNILLFHRHRGISGIGAICDQICGLKQAIQISTKDYSIKKFKHSAEESRSNADPN